MAGTNARKLPPRKPVTPPEDEEQRLLLPEEDQASVPIEPPAELPLTIKVRGFDFNAPGSLYGFLDMSDAQFELQDAFERQDQRGITLAMRKLLDGLRPFLQVDAGENLDSELRKLSVNNLFDLANAIKTHNPVPNESAPPSTNGHTATARLPRG